MSRRPSLTATTSTRRPDRRSPLCMDRCALAHPRDRPLPGTRRARGRSAGRNHHRSSGARATTLRRGQIGRTSRRSGRIMRRSSSRIPDASSHAYLRFMRSFEELVVSCGEAACSEWEYPALPNEWLQSIERRLPPGLRTTIAEAVENGSILIIGGHRFSLSGLEPSKGPYDSSVARQRRCGSQLGVLRPGSGVRPHFGEPSRLRVCKSTSRTISWTSLCTRRIACRLVYRGEGKGARLNYSCSACVKKCGHVDMNAPDWHNDPLRKSKYLLRHRPPYFPLLPSVSGST